MDGGCGSGADIMVAPDWSICVTYGTGCICLFGQSGRQLLEQWNPKLGRRVPPGAPGQRLFPSLERPLLLPGLLPPATSPGTGRHCRIEPFLDQGAPVGGTASS